MQVWTDLLAQPVLLRWSHQAAMPLDQWPCCLHCCCPCPVQTGSVLVLCSVGTAGTGSVLVLFQLPRVDATHSLHRSVSSRMNGFLQRLHRASFFSPSSPADIRGGSPGSRTGPVFIYPPSRNGRIRCCFNTFQSQISLQRPMVEKAETTKGSVPTAFSCDVRAKTSSPATARSLMLHICLSSDLFASFAISSRILNTHHPQPVPLRPSAGTCFNGPTQ